MADGLLNALDFGLLFSQRFVHRAHVKRSLQGFELGVPIDQTPTREDHIAPAKSVMFGSKFFGGDVKFVVAGSGHIAGVINPPEKNKYQFWTGPKPRSADIDGWLAKAKEHPGSWWPDWLVWITKQSPTEVPARVPGAGALKPIEDAPGSYVKVRD